MSLIALIALIQDVAALEGEWERLNWHFAAPLERLSIKINGDNVQGQWGDGIVEGKLLPNGTLALRRYSSLDHFRRKGIPEAGLKYLSDTIGHPDHRSLIFSPAPLGLDPNTQVLRGGCMRTTVWLDASRGEYTRGHHPAFNYMIRPTRPSPPGGRSFAGTWNRVGEPGSLNLRQEGLKLNGALKLGEGSWDVEGHAYADGVLKLVRYLPAQEVKSPSPTDLAAALKLHGDNRRTGHFRTSMYLRLHPASGELRGYFGRVEINPEGKALDPAEEVFTGIALGMGKTSKDSHISPGLEDAFAIPDNAGAAR